MKWSKNTSVTKTFSRETNMLSQSRLESDGRKNDRTFQVIKVVE